MSLAEEVVQVGGEKTALGSADATQTTDELIPEGEAVVYEEELLSNPYSLKLWLRYLEVTWYFMIHGTLVSMVSCSSKPEIA